MGTQFHYRSQGHDVYTEHVTKVALSSNDDKSYVRPENAPLLSCGHYKIPGLISPLLINISQLQHLPNLPDPCGTISFVSLRVQHMSINIIQRLADTDPTTAARTPLQFSGKRRGSGSTHASAIVITHANANLITINIIAFTHATAVDNAPAPATACASAPGWFHCGEDCTSCELPHSSTYVGTHMMVLIANSTHTRRHPGDGKSDTREHASFHRPDITATSCVWSRGTAPTSCYLSRSCDMEDDAIDSFSSEYNLVSVDNMLNLALSLKVQHTVCAVILRVKGHTVLTSSVLYFLSYRIASESTAMATLLQFQSTSLFYNGVAVAEWFACSPSTKANRVQSPAGSPDFRKWESCRTMPLVGGFSRGFPRFPRPFIPGPKTSLEREREREREEREREKRERGRERERERETETLYPVAGLRSFRCVVTSCSRRLGCHTGSVSVTLSRTALAHRPIFYLRSGEMAGIAGNRFSDNLQVNYGSRIRILHYNPSCRNNPNVGDISLKNLLTLVGSDWSSIGTPSSYTITNDIAAVNALLADLQNTVSPGSGPGPGSAAGYGSLNGARREVITEHYDVPPPASANLAPFPCGNHTQLVFSRIPALAFRRSTIVSFKMYCDLQGFQSQNDLVLKEIAVSYYDDAGPEQKQWLSDLCKFEVAIIYVQVEYGCPSLRKLTKFASYLDKDSDCLRVHTQSQGQRSQRTKSNVKVTGFHNSDLAIGMTEHEQLQCAPSPEPVAPNCPFIFYLSERLACLPPANANWVGSLRIFACGNCVGRCHGFSRVSPFPPDPSLWRRSILTSLIGSEDHDVESRPNIVTNSP
ncbi:hypothetical protein PR048_024198 [Dryococelus australis]|uniref:Uncharacterized protein n=1 Tax=Dryococelus australis TaxID=614101 RepID=A0ABQ9GW89_9NEOP|nr:hypothetical protein PR048_024198 [Dryococelus australis]